MDEETLKLGERTRPLSTATEIRTSNPEPMTSLSVLTTPDMPVLAGALSAQTGLHIAAAVRRDSTAALRVSLAGIPDWQGGPWALRWHASDAELRVCVAESTHGQAIVAIGIAEAEDRPEVLWRRALELGGGHLQFSPWPYGRLASCACVLRPTVDYVRRIDGLYDGRLRLVDAVRSLSAEQPTICLGHGRAGALAGALAPWLESQSPVRDRRRMEWMSFGAPAIGNQAFADGCVEHYGAATGRIFNRLDPVPYLWGGLGWLLRSYAGAVQVPTWLLDEGLDLMESLLRDGTHCRQPEGGVAMQGRLLGETSWLQESRLQHAVDTYQELLMQRFWRRSALY